MFEYPDHTHEWVHFGIAGFIWSHWSMTALGWKYTTVCRNKLPSDGGLPIWCVPSLFSQSSYPFYCRMSGKNICDILAHACTSGPCLTEVDVYFLGTSGRLLRINFSEKLPSWSYEERIHEIKFQTKINLILFTFTFYPYTGLKELKK